jgi:hypothetical protein
MRSVQEQNLQTFFSELRRGGTYNRKWWNPLEFSIYVNDLVRAEEIPTVVEIGTGNGVTSSWAALAGAHVWTCDLNDRPKVWEADIFPYPKLRSRIEYFTREGDAFLDDQMIGRKDKKNRELLILDGPSSEKGFRRQWNAVKKFANEGDIIVAPTSNQDIYMCFLSLRAAGFGVLYSTSTESYTIKWPADGSIRNW